ncbi:MAG: lipid II flippase MurJ [Actinomycetaceae bacterium]|nr:lipid II flippase MurJ [Actinomycetaceae bacterium]
MDRDSARPIMPTDEQPVGDPREGSIFRSSAVMAAGTLLSRLLGFVRAALLIVAIGAFGANDAFQVANTLPNAVYNLLAAGLLNAILVPQIVRAFKTKSGSTYVNRLLTLAGTVLFGLTIIMTASAALLVNLSAALMDPEWKAIAILFALWCLPQIFFYGLYSLLGEFLNARGVFGPYTWTPVVNNVIGISGLIIFIFLFGTGDAHADPQVWDAARIAWLALPATLGVVAQALLLLIPLRHTGVKLRLDFHFRGTGLRSASKIAGWVFATLVVGQVGFLSTSNISAAANAWGVEHGVFVASNTAMHYTFMVYMLPQSIVSVSIATVLFTRIATAAADNDHREMVRQYHFGVNTTLLLTMWMAAIIGAASVPIFQAIAFKEDIVAWSGFANALVVMLPGIAGATITLFSQRIFYSLENGKPVFITALVPTIVQIILGWTLKAFLIPSWWLAGALAAETVSRLLQAVIAVYFVRKFLPDTKPQVILRAVLHFGTVAIISGLAGAGVLHLIGAYQSGDSLAIRFFGAAVRGVLVAVIVTLIYFTLLYFTDREGSERSLRLVSGRIPFLARLLPTETTPDTRISRRVSPIVADTIVRDLDRPSPYTAPDVSAMESAAFERWRQQPATSFDEIIATADPADPPVEESDFESRDNNLDDSEQES